MKGNDTKNLDGMEWDRLERERMGWEAANEMK